MFLGSNKACQQSQSADKSFQFKILIFKILKTAINAKQHHL